MRAFHHWSIIVGLLGSLSVSFEADLSKLQSGINQAGSLLNSFSGGALAALGPVGDILLGVGAAAVGFGAASVSAAADFQQSMLKVQAYAGLTKQQADSMSKSILDMATQVGQSPKALADALYPIISSGYNAAQALDILKLSSMTSAASGAKTTVVADALTTSLKSMSAPASDAAKYMDIMNKTVSQGKTEFPQYAAIIGRTSLAARSANIPFIDMNAALATLTTHGFPSIAQASTALSNLFTQLGPKVDTMALNAQKLGLNFDKSAFSSMSLSDKIAYLNKVTGGNQGEILKLLGGSTTALKAFNSLTGATADYTNNLKALGNAQGTTASVFNTTSQGFNQSMARLNASFQVLLVKVGGVLLPLLTPLVDGVSKAVGAFSNWLGKSNLLSGGIGGLGKMLQPLFTAMTQNLLPAIMRLGQSLIPLIQHFVKWLQTSGVLQGVINALAGWWKFLGQAIDFVRPFIVQIIQAIGQFIAQIVERLQPLLQQFSAMWKQYWPVISSVLSGVFSEIVGIVKIAWAIISGIFKIALDLLSGNWKQVWTDIKDMLGGIWDGIKSYVSGALKILVSIITGIGGKIRDALMTPFNWAKQGIESFLGWVGNAIGNLGANIKNTLHNWHIPGFASGVMNFQANNSAGGSLALVGEQGPELIWLPNGSNVYPNGSVPQMGASGSSSSSPQSTGNQKLEIHVYLDGREVTNQIGPQIVQMIRASGAVGR